MTFKALVTQNERGRSMVEILGVLAVIGVLSIGGIQGYKYAMDKHRANDIVHSVNMRATDIWHLYQDGEKELPDSPEEDAFPEYGEMTQTGFEIMVTSHPPVAFRTWVNNVPSAVCQKVLQENLNDAITGLRFVQVNGTKYTDNLAICGDGVVDNQMVFTSFLDEDGGAVTGITDPNDPNGRPLENCVDNGDCSTACGEAVCDEDTLTCQNPCSGDTPVCMEETGVCVECRINADCQFKGEGYICNEAENKCTALQITCPKGTFRTQNGACVKCNDGNNFTVLTEPYPDTSDEVDGITMCQQCNDASAGEYRYNRKFGELEEGKGFCDYMCSSGRTYQSQSEGCISCNDDSWHLLTDDSISKAQCLACEGHEWYYGYTKGTWCQKKLECADDEYIIFGRPFTCFKCSESRNSRVNISWSSKSSESTTYSADLSDMCNNCPSEHARYAFMDYCYPVCEQPEGVESCDDPYNCPRKWQNSKGNCFACDDATTNNLIQHEAAYKFWRNQLWEDLCTACGRVVKDGYCVLPKEEGCGVGKFLGANGQCYECDNPAGVIIGSIEESGCLTNCRKVSSDATDYSADGTIETRRTYTFGTFYGTGNSLYCAPKCPANYINNDTGKCVSCGDSSSTSAFVPSVPSECSTQCPNRQVYSSSYCGIKTCPTTQKYYKSNKGSCVSCSRGNESDSGQTYAEDIALCNQCGNRMAYQVGNSTMCYQINPGEYGICNSLWSNELPDGLDSTLASKATRYLNGDYDGIKFLDNSGYCRDCTAEASYSTTKEQCLSCQNRRYQNGTCALGLCDTNFYLSDGTCIACSNVNKPIDPSRENLCSDCDNRRQMEKGIKNTPSWSALCVSTCDGAQWQDIAGTCYFCTEGGTKEIGTDNISRKMCQDCGRTVEEITDAKGDIVGYRCVEESA